MRRLSYLSDRSLCRYLAILAMLFVSPLSFGQDNLNVQAMPQPCTGNEPNILAVRQNWRSVMSNGCGPGGVANWVLGSATAIACGIDFGSACDGHDACYGECGPANGAVVTQANCDKRFYADMVRWCYQNYSNWNPCYNVCLNAASVYYTAVSRAAGSNFSTAQAQACLCTFGQANDNPPPAAPANGNCVCNCSGGAQALGPASEAPRGSCENVNGLNCAAPYCDGPGCSGTASNCHLEAN